MVQGVDYRIPMSAKGLDIGKITDGYLQGQDNQRRNALLELSQAQNQRTQESHEQKMQHLDDESRMKSILGFALDLQPYVESGDMAGISRIYSRRIQDIKSGGGNPSDSMELGPLVMSGDIEGIKNMVGGVLNKGRELGYLGSDIPSDIKAFNYKTKGLSEEDELKARRIDLGLDPRAGMSAQERIASDDGLADKVIGFESDKAGAVADARSKSDLENKPKLEAAITQARLETQDAIKKSISQKGQVTRFEQGLEVVNNLMPKGDGDLSILSKIYGRGESIYPKFLRSQEGIDAMAERDRFVNMLALGARGELKGQGPITDAEQGMLQTAITILKEPDISPELAARYIAQGRQILADSAGRSEEGGQTSSGSSFTSSSGITFEVQ